MNPVYGKYSLLPQLEKLTLPLFLPRLRREEKKAVRNLQKVYLLDDCPDDILAAVTQFVVLNHPLQYSLTYPATFGSVCNEIWEDVLIHRYTPERGNWLSAIHASFPGGWWPEDAIGKDFINLHSHIPSMSLANSEKIVQACIHNGPYQRYVWGVIFDDELNGHPRLTPRRFDVDKPRFFVKVETQIIVGFPEHYCFAFILRQHLIPEEKIDRAILLSSLLSMTAQQREYKSIPQSFVDYLEDSVYTLP